MESKTTFSEQLRRAVDDCGMTRYRICQRAGLDQATMSRFMRGAVGMLMPTLDRLVDVLDVELRPRTRAARRPKHGKAQK